MKRLLLISAIIEVGAGVGLLMWPAVVTSLLLGVTLASAAIPVARLCGTGLLALGLACWSARGDAQSPASKGMVAAMTAYNFGAVVILGTAPIQTHAVGLALWPAVALHGAMTFWCLASLGSARRG